MLGLTQGLPRVAQATRGNLHKPGNPPPPPTYASGCCLQRWRSPLSRRRWIEAAIEEQVEVSGHRPTGAADASGERHFLRDMQRGAASSESSAATPFGGGLRWADLGRPCQLSKICNFTQTSLLGRAAKAATKSSTNILSVAPVPGQTLRIRSELAQHLLPDQLWSDLFVAVD